MNENRFQNRPALRNSNDTEDQQIRRYVHSPLTIEHNGINASITENGRVVLSKVDEKASTKETVEYDEIEVPASLIFKLASLLKATRKVKYVTFAEMNASKTEESD